MFHSGQLPPLPDGFYWWRGDANVPAVIVQVKNDLVYQFGLEHTLSVSDMAGSWAGPLQEPKEVTSCAASKKK